MREETIDGQKLPVLAGNLKALLPTMFDDCHVSDLMTKSSCKSCVSGSTAHGGIGRWAKESWISR
jgi:hypothetical protein